MKWNNKTGPLRFPYVRIGRDSESKPEKTEKENGAKKKEKKTHPEKTTTLLSRSLE